MKTNLLLKRLLLLWIFAFSTSLWGQTTGTVTITRANFVSGALAYGTDDLWTATSSTGETITGYFDIYSAVGQSTMQTRTSSPIASYPYNTIALPGAIKSIVLTGGGTGTARAWTPFLSTSQLTKANYSSGTSQGAQTASSNSASTTWTVDTALGFNYFYINMTGGAAYLNSIVITYEMGATAPTITATPSSLSDFTYIVGSGPSIEQTFTVSGSSLTDNVSISAPANFEVSTTSGVDFGSSVTLAQTDGTVASTTVYARMIAGLAVNDYSENIVLSSVGATDVNVALSGNVTPIPSLPVVNDAEPIGKVGETFSFQVIASNDPTNYFVSSETLPVGLSLDGNSGLVTGTPTQAGEFITGIKATNGAGTSAEGTFIFTISKGTQTVILPDVNAYLGGDTIILPETTDKGLAIEYVSDDETVASVSGNVLTIVGLGSTEIFAGNDGNANYNLFTDSFSVIVTEAPAGPCGLENFDNSELTTSYANGSFVGNGGITWSYVQSRDENNQTGIDGKAIMLRRASDNSAISSSAISTGIGNFSVKLYKGFTGSGSRQVELFINGISHGISSSFDDNVEHLFEVNNINISGDFTLQIKNITGSQVILDDISWTCFANSSTTWDGTAWSNGDPDATKDAIIAGDYYQPSASGINALSLTVNANTTFILDSYINTGEVINNGNIIVSSYGNFVHNGNFAVGSGSTFKVARTSNPVKRQAYIAWSSPLKNSPQTLKEFSYGSNNSAPQSQQGTLDNRFYTYNAGTYVSTPSTGVFNPAGQGFQIRTPNDFTTTPQSFLGLFVGTEPNEGDFNYDASGITGDYVFLGNPYPSALDMEVFYNSNAAITGEFYIWDSNSEMDSDNNYSGTNYKTYTRLGSVPAQSESGYVPVGQGFFVNRGGNPIDTFKFKNSMRSIDHTGSFSKASVLDRFWLQMNTPSGTTPQMLIGFDANATAGYDAGYDAKMFDNNADVIYSVVDARSLVIDAHGTFTTTDVINVSANFLSGGNYTMSIAQKEGVFTSGQQIYLKDNVTGIETELTAGDYNFAATSGLQVDRFTVYFSKGVLASSTVTKGQSTIYADHQVVHVKGTSKITSVEVYDMSGKMINKLPAVHSSSTSFPVSYKGIVIVKLVMENGEVVTKKIILK